MLEIALPLKMSLKNGIRIKLIDGIEGHLFHRRKINLYNVIKKDGTIEPYNEQKIIDACNKAARRAMYELSHNDYAQILNDVLAKIDESYNEDTDIEIYDMDMLQKCIRNMEKWYLQWAAELSYLHGMKKVVCIQ